MKPGSTWRGLFSQHLKKQPAKVETRPIASTVKCSPWHWAKLGGQAAAMCWGGICWAKSAGCLRPAGMARVSSVKPSFASHQRAVLWHCCHTQQKQPHRCYSLALRPAHKPLVRQLPYPSLLPPHLMHSRSAAWSDAASLVQTATSKPSNARVKTRLASGPASAAASAVPTIRESAAESSNMHQQRMS